MAEVWEELRDAFDNLEEWQRNGWRAVAKEVGRE